MTQHAIRQFLSASKTHLGRHQPKAASETSSPYLASWPRKAPVPLPEREPSTS